MQDLRQGQQHLATMTEQEEQHQCSCTMGHHQ